MEIPRHWRLKKQRYALIGEVCPHCDAKLFPPRRVHVGCPSGPSAIQVEESGVIIYQSQEEPSLASTSSR